MDTDDFSAYGISVAYPRDWTISFDRRRGFLAHDGFVKFEDAGQGREPQASFTLQWEDAHDCTDFADKYYVNVEKQFKKVFKRKDNYRLGAIEIVSINNHKACLVRGEYLAGPSLFGVTRKKEHLANMQLAFQCDKMRRILVGNITALNTYYKEEGESLQKMMFSIHCHA
ncbi:MAG: hypothetical protein LUC93_03755 [Planctomycetaceae bacterium]|nr:hypothetical protein [Planctomycetaceae bacterium]